MKREMFFKSLSSVLVTILLGLALSNADSSISNIDIVTQVVDEIITSTSTYCSETYSITAQPEENTSSELSSSQNSVTETRIQEITQTSTYCAESEETAGTDSNKWIASTPTTTYIELATLTSTSTYCPDTASQYSLSIANDIRPTITLAPTSYTSIIASFDSFTYKKETETLSPTDSITTNIVWDNVTTTITIFLNSTTPTYIPTGTCISEITSTKSLISETSVASSSELSVSITASSLKSDVTISSSTVQTSSQTADFTCSTIDLFQPIDTKAPFESFETGDNGFDLPSGVYNYGDAINTNKFYANLFIESQSNPVFLHPYSVWWASKSTSFSSIAVSHTKEDQLVFGDDDSNNAPSYFINPIKILSMGFSSSSFTDGASDLIIDEMTDTAVRATLQSTNSDSDKLAVYLTQGMGLLSATYSGNLVVALVSQVGFQKVVRVTSENILDKTIKFRATLYNTVDWLIYVTLPSSAYIDAFDFDTTSSELIANFAIDGLLVQIAVAPENEDLEISYDLAAGIYITDVTISGYYDECTNSAIYSFNYVTEGSSLSGNSLIFALPHHEDLLTKEIRDTKTGISLFSLSKGYAEAYLTTKLEFYQVLESTEVGYLPFSTLVENRELKYTNEQIQLLADTSNLELSVDFSTYIKGLSTYYGGKYIDKFSYILLVVSEIIQDEESSKNTLKLVKDAFDQIFNGNLLYKLIYDTKNKGIISNAIDVSGSNSADFGNPYYNDHHFHYGYYIHAAAVIGYVDKSLGGTWAEDHMDFINALVRDVNNPSREDSYFPVSRNFDWYHGHSWAAGTYESSDGKNQESSSEDYNFAYGMKLWGKTIGDKSMELRGDLMIDILKGSLNKYYYYMEDNNVEPTTFTKNRLGGIVFDNKIDHTTFFGTNQEYIYGIHMIPTTPISSIIRGPDFTKLEWNDIISTFIDSVESGWTGLLRLDQALFDPSSSYNFFSESNFDYSLLDDGQSRTWSLAYSGGILNQL